MSLRRCLSFVLVAILVLTLTRCASYTIRHVDVRPPDQYDSLASDGALTVAVEPLDTEQKARAIFNTDLNRAGFLAVNLIVRNDSPQPFQMNRQSIYLVDTDGIQLLPTTAAAMLQGAGTSLAKWYFISGIVGAISANRARRTMEQDFMDKELYDQIIPSGITVYGFLYFQHQVQPPDGAQGYRVLIANSPAGQSLEVFIN